MGLIYFTLIVTKEIELNSATPLGKGFRSQRTLLPKVERRI